MKKTAQTKTTRRTYSGIEIQRVEKIDATGHSTVNHYFTLPERAVLNGETLMFGTREAQTFKTTSFQKAASAIDIFRFDNPERPEDTPNPGDVYVAQPAHTWEAEKARIEKRKARKAAGRKRWILETPDHRWQVAQDTGGAYFMNWAEGTGPLTLVVFAGRSEALRSELRDKLGVEELVWTLYDAERPQWWTHHTKGADEVFDVIAA
jgi:hypothetical protein